MNKSDWYNLNFYDEIYYYYISEWNNSQSNWDHSNFELSVWRIWRD